MSIAPSRLRALSTGYLSALVLLTMQFTLGMALNLFVEIPKKHPGSNPPEYFGGVLQSVTWAVLHGPLLLVLHASLGLILVLGAAQLIFSAVRARATRFVVVSAIGGLAVLSAGFNGGSFLNYHEDFSSMIMASFFAIAVVTYSVGLYLTAQPRTAVSVS